MGTFYFHPELDMLHVSDQRYLPKFADLLWKHDPRRVGLINLSLINWYIQPALTFYNLLHTKEKVLVRQFLSRLRKVYLGYTGRMETSVADGTDVASYKGLTASRNLRSRPLLACVSRFHRLQQDPTPVKNDLSKVFIKGGDLRQQIYGWFRLLERWKIKYPHHTVDYRFLIATCTFGCQVTTREGALQYAQQADLDSRPRQPLEEDEATRNDAEPAFPEAFGFWLFPITAFGPIPEPKETKAPFTWNVGKSLDLSGCIPELCLQILPEAKVSEVFGENSVDQEVCCECDRCRENVWFRKRRIVKWFVGWYIWV
jgi:hypothetical protein